MPPKHAHDPAAVLAAEGLRPGPDGYAPADLLALAARRQTTARNRAQALAEDLPFLPF